MWIHWQGFRGHSKNQREFIANQVKLNEISYEIELDLKWLRMSPLPATKSDSEFVYPSEDLY